MLRQCQSVKYYVVEAPMANLSQPIFYARPSGARSPIELSKTSPRRLRSVLAVEGSGVLY
jgi:hypothetical protein